MQIWTIALVISLFGAAGGLVNAFIVGDLHLPHREDDVYSPGWIGSVVTGAITALVFWAMYHPSSSLVVFIGDSRLDTKASLTIAETAGSIIAGIGGARLLSSKVKKNVFQERARSSK